MRDGCYKGGGGLLTPCCVKKRIMKGNVNSDQCGSPCRSETEHSATDTICPLVIGVMTGKRKHHRSTEQLQFKGQMRFPFCKHSHTKGQPPSNSWFGLVVWRSGVASHLSTNELGCHQIPRSKFNFKRVKWKLPLSTKRPKWLAATKRTMGRTNGPPPAPARRGRRPSQSWRPRPPALLR